MLSRQVKDEQTLVNDLSWNLSNRYQKPLSLIMISVQHSALLCLGGTFDPAYLLTITALPSQVQATTNKRNTAMIQTFLADLLNVSPDRGIIRFDAIPEENLAINGKTILGEVERLEKQQAEENPGALKHALSRTSRKSTKSKSRLNLSRKGSSVNPDNDAASRPRSPEPISEAAEKPKKRNSAFTHGNGYLVELSSMDGRLNGSSTSHDLRTKKSSPGGLQSFAHPSPPPIPEDPPLQTLPKRKSLKSIFTRR